MRRAGHLLLFRWRLENRIRWPACFPGPRTFIMQALLNRYCRLLDHIQVGLLAFMTVLVFVNVALRYLFNSGITVSEEVARWAFIWIVFLGAIVALNNRTHLGSDLFYALLPRVLHKPLFILGRLLMLYIAWLVLAGSWEQMMINADIPAPTTEWSMGIFYATGVIFGSSALLLIARDLCLAVLHNTGVDLEDEPAISPEDSQ